MRGAVFSLNKVQIGKESVPGTAVPTTEILLATAEVELDYPLFRSQTPFGVMAQNAGPTKLLSKDVNIGLNFDGLTFEQAGWVLGMIDKATTTGTATPYTHDYAPGVAALWAPESYTIEAEWTDGTVAEDIEFEYCMARSITFSLEQQQQLQVKCDMFARQATDAAITSPSLPTTLSPIIASQAILYTLDTYSAADATPPSTGEWDGGVILSAELNIDLGIKPFHGISGVEYFTEHKETAKNFELTLTVLYDTTAGDSPLGERAHAIAGDLRFFTIQFIGTGNHKLRLTVAGKHEMGDFLGMSENDGLVVVDMKIIGHHDPTGAHLVTAELVNDEADPL